MDDFIKFIQTNNTNALVVAIVAAMFGALLTRLLPWLLNQLYRSVKWVVAFVSGHGHDYEFERKYLTWLISRHGYLGLLPSNVAVPMRGQRQAVELEQVFVELALMPTGSPNPRPVLPTHDIPVKELVFERRPADSFRQSMGRGQRAGSQVQGSELGQIIEEYPRLVIRGDPGSGKTTLMKYLAVTCARALRNRPKEGDDRNLVRTRLGWKERPFPILVSLGRQSGVTAWDKDRDLVAAFADEFEHELAGCPQGFFERRLKRGHCLILLDAFDEIGSREGRNAMGHYIVRLCNSYHNPTNRIVVTTRIVGYEGQLDRQGFAVQTVQPLTRAQMDRLVRQRYRAIALNESLNQPSERSELLKQELARRAERLIAEIERNPRLRELATNPLLLSLIVLVHSVKVELPEERHILYRDCVEILTQHWRQANKEYLQAVAPKEELNLQQKIALLETLGLAMQQQRTRPEQGQAPLRRSAAQDLLAEQLAQFLAPQLPGDPGERRRISCDRAGEWLDGIKQESGILVEVGLDKPTGDPLISFSHLTFQEYLAARALTLVSGTPELLIENRLSQVWQEVLLLYIAMSPPARANEIVNGLLDVSSRADPRGLLTSARCLSDKVVLDAATNQRIQDGIDDLVRRGPEDQRTSGCEALIKLGTREAVELLATVVETDSSWRMRYMAAQGLGRLGDPRDLDEMVAVPAGEFLYGKDKETRTIAKPFRLGKYPVTNAQYKRFVEATGNAVPFQDQDWARPYNWDQTSSAFPEGKANHPVVIVSWTDAQAYCQWLSRTTGKAYRLPTEEEWERAARGTDGREYPWGNEFDAARCNTSESGIRGTSPAGIFKEGASPCGALDMAGNVWEWTGSDYDKSSKVLRGGSWFDLLVFARCASRSGVSPDDRFYSFGFRVAESALFAVDS